MSEFSQNARLGWIEVTGIGCFYFWHRLLFPILLAESRSTGSAPRSMCTEARFLNHATCKPACRS